MRRAALASLLLTILPPTVTAQTPPPPAADPAMRGHGGPIRSLVVLDDKTVVTGGFDTAIIVWDVTRGAALRVRRHHDGAVNALARAGPGCLVSGGDEGRIVRWCEGPRHVTPIVEPHVLIGRHDAPIAALATTDASAGAASPIVTGGMDGALVLWPRDGTRPRILGVQKGPITGIAVSAGGKEVVSASYGGEVRVTALGSLDDTPPPVLRRRRLPSALNGLALLPDGRIAVTAADGHVRVLAADLEPSFEIETSDGPLTSVKVSPDGKLLAVAGMRTTVSIIDIEKRLIVRRILGPGLPVWALAFSADGRELFTGGADRALRRWNLATGEAIGTALSPPGEVRVIGDEEGARVFRACAACHTIDAGEGHRAGPTLAGIMGRRIATAPGYAYSSALVGMDIVWTPETIARLFEIGPNAYTPGTKMPEQRITSPEDRKALVEWLARVTAP